MIDLVLGQRWHLAIDSGFVAPQKIENMLGDLGDPELRSAVSIRCICSADYQNEVLIDDDQTTIVIDLTTVETAFSFVAGFLTNPIPERAPTLLALLRMMTTLSLPFGDQTLTAGFLSEYVSERARIEAAHEPDGFHIDQDSRDDLIAKDAISAFIVGHEAGHFLYKRSPAFRNEMIDRVRYTVVNALAVVETDALNVDGRSFLSGVLSAIDSDPFRGPRANDVEELVCDFSAGEAALNALANKLSEPADIRTAFVAIQGAVATNWVIEAARDAFQYVVLHMPSGRAHRNELLAGRSLVTALNLAAHRYKGIEGREQPEDEAFNRLLADIPDVDELLVSRFNTLWSPEAQLRREYLGAIHTQVMGLADETLIKSTEAVLRHGIQQE